LRSSSRNTEAQLGSSYNDWDPGHNLNAQSAHDSFQVFFGPVEHCRNRTEASRSKDEFADGDLEARSLKNFERGTARIGMKVIVNVSAHKTNFALMRCSGGRSPGVFPETGTRFFLAQCWNVERAN